MSKRVYLAGPWVDRLIMPQLASRLEAAGHYVTHPWWQYEGAGESTESEEFLRKCAQLDVDGVSSADVVLVYNSAKSEGKATEQGIAIALGKPIVCLTPFEKVTSNIFHHLALYTHVTSMDEAMEVIGG